MGVLIDGLKMPKRMPIQALIYPDGRVFVRLHSGKTLQCRVVQVETSREADKRGLSLRRKSCDGAADGGTGNSSPTGDGRD